MTMIRSTGVSEIAYRWHIPLLFNRLISRSSVSDISRRHRAFEPLCLFFITFLPKISCHISLLTSLPTRLT